MKAPKFTSTGVVVALVAGMLVTGVVVAAAHGGSISRRTIHACVDNQTGAVEIVHAGSSCGQGADPLDWNGKGPRGPAGPPGPQGSDGFATTTVVTRSQQFVASAPGATTLIAVVGLGVDCPGDATATGGGGTITFGSLTSSVPLEHDSTVDVAETGDRSTGWWVAGTLGFNNVVSIPAGNGQQAPTVTVYAVCAATDSGPPPWDQDA